MPLWKNTQHSFAAGQLDTHVMGRQDMDKYAHGATLLKNFLVKRQGCISKRRGTDLTANLDGLLGTAYDGTPITPNKMRLVPVTNGDDGRYVILSGGVGFVASRDGILTSDGRHVRAIAPYAAQDEDGNPVAVGGRDDRKSDDTPIDLVHRIGTGNYEVTRHATLQAAFDAAVDGDTLRFHNNYLLTDTVYLRAERFTPSDGVASTFALDGATWKMTRGGTTYTATSSGRDIIDILFPIGTMTATRTWTFSTSHTNRSFTLGWNYPGWKLTAVDSAEAAGTADDLSVAFSIDGADLTATRADTSSSWSFSDGKTWAMAFSGDKWTASRTIGSANSSNRDIATPGFTVTLGGESVTATSTWSFSDGGDWSVTYSNPTFRFSNPNYATMALNGSYDTTSFSVSRRVRAARDSKQLTIDLYGYKLTVFQRSHIYACTPNVGLTFTSGKPGAKAWCISNSNCSLLRCQTASASTGSSTRIGTMTFDGDIDWRMNGGNSNYMFNLQDCREVVFRSGTFTDTSENPDNLGDSFYFQRCGSVTIHGGKFDGGLSTGNLRMFNSYDVNIVVNGGEVTLARTGRNSMMFSLYSSGAGVTINGGRFTCEKDNFCNKAVNRDHSLWSASNQLHVVRGEFSFAELKNYHDHTYYPIDQYGDAGTVANEANPSADGYYGVKQAGEGDYRWIGRDWWGTPYRFAVPYADADLADLCIRQSGDTLFVAHRDYPPAKIYFDRHGSAFFEELALDNTDYQPPVIDSAVMSGNDPAETDWAGEFPRPKASGDNDADCVTHNGASWYVGKVPSWIRSHKSSVSLNGTSQTPVKHLIDFVTTCKGLGTVTDAGYSGNDSAGNDSSYSRAASFTCTSVNKDLATGRKTTTVSVISFTASRTVEKTTTFTDGLATGCTSENIDTFGVASNSASATSVLVARTIRYVATYVKDGKESRPSFPVAVDYDMPWANNAVVNLSLSKGANNTEPEYYNLYKDNGNGYGLIGTTIVDSAAGGIRGTANTYDLYLPDNKAAAPTFLCAADYETRRGWPVGDMFRKLVSRSADTFTSSTDSDLCLFCPASRQNKGIVFDFESAHGADFNRIEFMLDGRIYDRETNQSYLIYSQPKVNCYIDYYKKDGTSGSFSVLNSYPDCGTAVTGPYSGVTGTPKIMVGLRRKTFHLPSGDPVVALSLGAGDAADMLADMVRHVSVDLAPSMPPDYSKVKRVRLTFGHLYGWELFGSDQGCIHSVHFYKNSSTAGAGMFQDDYINPDMTVTPPDDTQDAHFSAADEYPGCVGIYEQRLVFASTRSSPSTIWMSRIADLYNFTAHESIREDDALELTLAATEFPNINHLVMGRDLMLFGDGGEWLISPVTGNALTYKTASAKLQSMVGSDRALQPLQLADETLFAERGGTCLRSINYNYNSDSYQSNDLSVIAQSIFRANPIVSMAYKQHPDSIVECVLADGRVGTLVYMKEQEVAAWSVQELGGGWKAREIVTPKCIMNGTTEMMLLVEKEGVYQLWKVRDDIDEPVASKQVVLDGIHVERTDAAGTGEVAVALGNGAYAVGFPVVSEFVSVRPEPEKGATAQMEIKNATESEIRVIGASTFSVKPYAIDTGWREVALPVVRSGSDVALAEKDCRRLVTGTNNRDGRIHVRHAEPWPLTILSISNTYQVEYENEEGKGEGQ